LRSDVRGNAIGLLHEEMRRLGSLILEVADQNRVPAGRALAVDRDHFSRGISERIEACSQIEVIHEEVKSIPEGCVILASGPLTSESLAGEIQALCGESLYFYDSISPTVYLDSLDVSQMFRASRYDSGDPEEGDYLNIPLDREGYQAFVSAVAAAEKLPLHEFEKPQYFEGCLPIEVMIERGEETLRFGPMKPVGLTDPRTGRWPHAALQLRQEDKRGTLYSMVGFQTKLRQGEQKRIFRMLPGMQEAVFARFGSVHRNTFVNAPELLDARLQHRTRTDLVFAGQMAGVEGYVESSALGLLAGIFVAAKRAGAEAPLPPPETAHGALLRHLSDTTAKSFQPMNVNYGLFPPLDGGGRRVPKRERNQQMSERALAALEPFARAVAP
jgi:methylenetetrahydrofolate--tRNA-(uracil-5-)-methyltransferase